MRQSTFPCNALPRRLGQLCKPRSGTLFLVTNRSAMRDLRRRSADRQLAPNEYRPWTPFGGRSEEHHEQPSPPMMTLISRWNEPRAGSSVGVVAV
ncbi:hypothetical protein HBI56_223250 [Parastagonospora nodorum]|uniref:Uncharacterized protein n=1 Tax=Phaeosphaeria nodorum (strain SN15 / ATCC MYA-4574 / FGSC 10173) TaxID=321614 RepID=A0A7U2EWL3_PHANO|nr:hypothetical protein HBH56_147740 [Parastagonospora nodorum]QRC94057.1 hypothetical protein JI435_405080 [Parastagonospora nodorum SN15]KAH3923212.1 hypothetical protein HBH54_212380 [Parastagonospora nodorum]KAH3945865.1 hypothetical protein HBH53_135200 [Parastagonospora nodorum]KAH3984047.1 hypothetical protein HBH52_064840 [Parastagonospora nodorum]